MTPDGTVLDSIVICDAAQDQLAPSVSCSDSIYLVCWSGKDVEFYNVYCARISSNGTVLDEDGFAVYPDTVSQSTPVTAYDGNNFIIVWCEYDSHENSIRAIRVNGEGVVIDSTPITISKGIGAKYNVAISFDGSNFMAIWDDARISGTEYDEWAARVTPQGVLLDTNGIPVDTSPGSQYRPSISFCEPYYLAMWSEDISGSPDIYAKRISPSGVLIDSSPLPVCTASGYQEDVASCAVPDGYALGWKDGRLGFENSDIYGSFIDTSGSAIGEKGIEVSPIQDISFFAAPNPFKTSTTITISRAQVHKNTRVQDIELNIYDLSGRFVKSFTLTTNHSPFYTEVYWDGKDRTGKKVPAGVYLVKLQSGRSIVLRKLVLFK